MEIFKVGGIVRDEILGAKSKDIDFVVVLSDEDFTDPALTVVREDPFLVMVAKLERMGFTIFLSTPEHFTVRAQFPSLDARTGSVPPDMNPDGSFNKLTADFVLARKESGYSDGRRPDKVEVGTLLDDLARRDFTMNAIAKDAAGTLIDPFNGVQDINEGVIRAVGTAFDRLTEDALRAVRALRFSVTKGFRIDHELAFAMQSAAVVNLIENVISDERINDELSTMFRFDTLASLDALGRFPLLTDALFSGRVSLDSTLKQRGRGK